MPGSKSSHNRAMAQQQLGSKGKGQKSLLPTSSSQQPMAKEFIYLEGAGGSDMEEDEDDEEGDMSSEDDSDTETSGKTTSRTLGSGKKWLLQQQQQQVAEEEDNEENSDDGNMEVDESKEQDKKTPAAVSKYRQRVLILSSRGITHRYRHLLNDLHTLLPHSKKDSKIDGKGQLSIVNELAELSNCNNCIFFDIRKHQDLYMWISKTPNGPSARFLIENVHTMDELKMTGNCLKGSRPILSFDAAFDTLPHLQLLKEMLTHTFATPRTSRKLKPFVDHVLSFTIVGEKIWFRHYQIVEKTVDKKDETSLVEIGPRFVMHLMRIFDGSFGGSTLYENSTFISPNDLRRAVKDEVSAKYKDRVAAQADREARGELNQLPEDPLADVFQ